MNFYARPLLGSKEGKPMGKKVLSTVLMFLMLCSLAACGTTGQQDAEMPDISENSSYESVEGTQIKMITENTEVVITLNDSRAAADLAAMLPLELTLIERNSFAKGMTLPEHLSSMEETTREYEIGDFGYWDAGPDLAIFSAESFFPSMCLIFSQFVAGKAGREPYTC